MAITHEFHPEITTTAREVCAECDEFVDIDLCGVAKSKQLHAARRALGELGWKVMMPHDRDYIGPVCPKCQKQICDAAGGK